jgi:hypothetical protein
MSASPQRMRGVERGISPDAGCLGGSAVRMSIPVLDLPAPPPTPRCRHAGFGEIWVTATAMVMSLDWLG